MAGKELALAFAIKLLKYFKKTILIKYVRVGEIEYDGPIAIDHMNGSPVDSPVSMLIGAGGSSNVTITYPNGRKDTGTSFVLHWVTITELEINEINDKAKVKVSSWGGWGEVDLDEYIQNEWLYQGLRYFE
ncbi:hypothetical protein [Lacrimispora sp.]|uniref:hypothetical protein n=1 Tax=Lacrimispora sp. TaxID=2719234 RepID=UPI0032E517A8